MKPRTVVIGPVLPPKTRHWNLTTWPPIKYLSCDRIVTWSVYRSCSFTSSFISRFQICDPTNIRGVTIKNPRISLRIGSFFHSHSMNISQIANLNAGGERAHNSAQSTYWSYYSTIRTHILNWSQNFRNCKFGTTVWFQPGQIPVVLCPGLATTRQVKSGAGFCPGLEPNKTKPLAKTQTHCYHYLPVHLWVYWISISNCISKLAQSRPRSVSLISLDRHFRAHLELLSSTACSQSRYYTLCRWVAIRIHRREYKLNTWVVNIVEQ